MSLLSSLLVFSLSLSILATSTPGELKFQENILRLNNWVIANERWPNKESKEYEEVFLARWVTRAGGQRKVFLNYLNYNNKQWPEIRIAADFEAFINEWVTSHGDWPAESGSFEQRILARGVRNHGDRKTVSQKYLTPENRTRVDAKKAETTATRGLNVIEELRNLVELKKDWPDSKIPEEKQLADFVQGKGYARVAKEYLLPHQMEYQKIQDRVDPMAFLNRWIASKQGWPEKRSSDSDELFLANFIGKQGGRKKVLPLLSPENQKIEVLALTVRTQNKFKRKSESSCENLDKLQSPVN